MERLSYCVTAEDGTSIPFDLYCDTPPRTTLLIVCPGFWQSKQSPIMQRMAWALAERADVVCIDFRGHGASRAWYTFSAKEHLDLEAVLSWAKARYAHLALIGCSLGGAIALNAAARVGGVRAIITLGTPAAFEAVEFRWWHPEAIRSGLRSLGPGTGTRPAWPWMRKLRPVDSVAALAGTPLFFIHGTDDPIVSSRHSERLYAAAKDPKRLELIEGGGHAEHLFRQTPGRLLALIGEWLTQTLDAKQPPPQVTRVHGYLTVRPGMELFYQRWTVREQASARPLVIVHGGGEHSGRYDALATRLAGAGFAVWAYDLEGHGRSPGVRGHVRRMEDYTGSVGAVIAEAARVHGGQAPILFGHSLGGLIATCYAAATPGTIAALALSSPLWGLALRVPWWKRLVAHLISPIWPSLTLPRSVGGQPLISHDPEIVRRYLTDPLMHYVASARLYTELQHTIAALPSLLPRITVPTLVQQAGDDAIASAEAVRRQFPLLGASRKTLRIYEGFYHEIFNEVGKEQVIGDLLQWLKTIEYTQPNLL